MSNVRTPVVIIIFNRPDLTEKLFREVARAKPTKLLVIADGPRPDRAGEAERCAATRAIVDRVDWPCEILKNYSDTNLGCKRRVASGITWAFEQVEEAIILEDDCIPDPTFFRYCDEMLERFRTDERVMLVCGTNFLGDEVPRDSSYYFSRLPLIWGWATWRRAWKHYDIAMGGWPALRESKEFSEILPDFMARHHYRRQLDRTFAGQIDTWDLQWSNTVWQRNGVAIIPTSHLIRNLGFGPEATHTHFYDPVFDPPVVAMPFPLKHPPKDERPRPELDRIWLRRHYSPAAKVRRRIRAFARRFAGAGP